MSSAGTTIVNSYFEQNLVHYATDESRKIWAQNQLDTLSFLYKDPSRRAGVLRGPFVIGAIASYLVHIQGKMTIPTLVNTPYYFEDPVGGIALAVASVSSLFTLRGYH